MGFKSEVIMCTLKRKWVDRLHLRKQHSLALDLIVIRLTYWMIIVKKTTYQDQRVLGMQSGNSKKNKNSSHSLTTDCSYYFLTDKKLVCKSIILRNTFLCQYFCIFKGESKYMTKEFQNTLREQQDKLFSIINLNQSVAEKLSKILIKNYLEDDISHNPERRTLAAYNYEDIQTLAGVILDYEIATGEELNKLLSSMKNVERGVVV